MLLVQLLMKMSVFSKMDNALTVDKNAFQRKSSEVLLIFHGKITLLQAGKKTNTSLHTHLSNLSISTMTGQLALHV